jgi:hypothetical protein
VLGLAAGISASFLSVGSDDDSVRALLDTTTFLTTMADPPSVVTTSYGGDETAFSPQDLQYASSFGASYGCLCVIVGRCALDTWPQEHAVSP